MSKPDAPIFTSLELLDFCGFSRFQIDLQPLTVLVGPNNGGKTTILRAVKFLTDCLELALPTYRKGLIHHRQNVNEAQAKYDTAMREADKAREKALRELKKEGSDLAEREQQRQADRARQQYEQSRQQAENTLQKQQRNLMQQMPKCRCDVKNVAQRQFVESLDTFFYQHSAESTPTLVAVATTSPAPTAITAKITREPNGKFWADLSFTIDGSDIMDVPPEDGDAALKALEGMVSEYVQPICNLTPSEGSQSWPQVQQTLNKGKPHEVWRNQIHWLSEGAGPESFQRVIERVRHAMPSVELSQPSRTRDQQPRVLVEFEENGVKYDVAESGNGFRTLLSIAASLELSKASVFLFDEPDSHLHSAIQRELSDFIAMFPDSHRQVILCTHSPDMIDQLPLESLAWVDRESGAARLCSDTAATLVELGALTQTEAVAPSSGHALLYFEAKPDRKSLAALLSRHGDADWFSGCSLSELGGRGDVKYLPHVLRFMKDHHDKEFKAAAIVDSDYTYPDELISGPEDGVLVCHLPCKEIENLILLQPKVIKQALEEVAERKRSFTGESTPVPDVDTITQWIDDILTSQDIADLVADHWIMSHLPENADGGHHKAAREEFQAFWRDSGNRRRFGPGKRTLARLRHRVQSELKLTLQALSRLFEFYDPEKDMVLIMDAIRDHLAEPQTEDVTP
jgi:ABC-type transport system involved in cytochrome c biogenesis ATPase subunit